MNIKGEITSVHRDCYEVYIGNDNFISVKKNKKIGEIVVGDFCELEEKQEHYYIKKILPRETSFFRVDPDPSEKKIQLLAANFNYIFCVMSLNNNFNLKRLERLIILSYNSGAIPIVVLTKSDLVKSTEPYITEIKKIVSDISVITTSIITGDGFEKIKKFLVFNNKILLIGSSGVGKSSLINTIVGKDILKTSQIREWDDRGRHTTVSRKMIILENGAKIIDTPGIRSFGMMNIENAIDHYFHDIVMLVEQCKFKNCTHRSEPGCAIRNALKNGLLSGERYDNYKLLLKEANTFNKENKKHVKYNRKKFKDTTTKLLNELETDY